MAKHNTVHLTLEQFKGAVSEAALEVFYGFVEGKNVIIKHVAARKTKLGDFRHFRDGKTPVITVNRQLSSEALTFIIAHELAHFLVYLQCVKKVQPHGVQWKTIFSEILKKLIDKSAFTLCNEAQIKHFMQKPKATVSRNTDLYDLLFPGNEQEKGKVKLCCLHAGSRFTLPGNQRIFIKGVKKRIRFVCQCTSNKRFYLISGNCKVNTSE